MDDIDPNTISNGTCYWAKGKKMHPSYIPCGNDLYGHKHCCWAGDSCLVDNACFGIHGGTGDGTWVTYLAGCSDPDYEDQACPDKKPFRNQPWAGLILCPHDVDTWVWLACSEHGAPTTPARSDPCTCSPDDASKFSRPAAFTVFSDGTRLTEEGKLPITAGGTINFNEGMEPTITTTLTLAGPAFSSSSPSTSTTSRVNAFTTRSVSSNAPSTTTAPETGVSSGSPTDNSPTPSDVGESGSSTGPLGADGSGNTLSTGQKAGIAVGAGIAGLAILAAIIFLVFLVLRARRSREMASVSPPPSDTVDPHQGYPVGSPEGGHGSNSMSPATGVSEMESAGARPWSLRSELDTSGPGASPPLGVYSDGQHIQPHNLSPSQTIYGSSFGMQNSQQWTAPYPPDAYAGTGAAGTSAVPEAQPATGRQGGSHYIHELG